MTTVTVAANMHFTKFINGQLLRYNAGDTVSIATCEVARLRSGGVIV